MDTDAEAIREMSPREISVAEPISLVLENPDTARSARNILQWRSYLPRACVKTMIKMGWDQTT
jgi:hypothetical protein